MTGSGWKRRAIQSASGVLLVVPLLLASTPGAGAEPFTPLTLINGWTNAPFSTRSAAVTKSSGIVRLQGAIATTGSNPEPFVLPAGFRPVANVYVVVDLCDATNGRLFIQNNGVVTVEAESGNFSNAQCFTSLDGVSFAISATGFTKLSLQNGWTNSPFSTRKAAAIKTSGVVHLEGAIATTGTNAVPFTLPSAFRPPVNVYVAIDLCDATNGRLYIQSNGVVTVQAENGTFSNAQCFTSLEGASYVTSTIGSTSLALKNGWTNSPYGNRHPTVKNLLGVVTFAGAMATSKSNPVAFTLPVKLRPSAGVYVAVDLCNATNGRLFIQSNGVVTVQAEGGTFGNAQCFTSLEGAFFHL